MVVYNFSNLFRVKTFRLKGSNFILLFYERDSNFAGKWVSFKNSHFYENAFRVTTSEYFQVAVYSYVLTY